MRNSIISLNLVLEEQFSVRDQMVVSFPQGSVVCDTRVIWLLFQYVPCYLSCSIYLLSNLLWCAQTSNLSTSQSVVCGWSVTKIDEGHSSAKGKGHGAVCQWPPSAFLNPSNSPHPLSIHPSFPLSCWQTVTEDWGLFWSAWTDGHQLLQEKEKKDRGTNKKQIWWEKDFDWNLWREKYECLSDYFYTKKQ